MISEYSGIAVSVEPVTFIFRIEGTKMAPTRSYEKLVPNCTMSYEI
jgi:hypothetical protein